MFYRRLNFSIEDIGRILYKSSFPSYCSMIQEKSPRKNSRWKSTVNPSSI